MRLDPNGPGYISAEQRHDDVMRIGAMIGQTMVAPGKTRRVGPSFHIKLAFFRPKRADPTDPDINPAYRRNKED